MKTFVVFLTLYILLVAGCAKQVPPTDIQVPPSEIRAGAQDMNQEICKKAGGNWNECSSACLGTGADVCMQVCVAQCECGGIAGFRCPAGYDCKLTGKVADELGACKKKV
jgi:hypothetical protein